MPRAGTAKPYRSRILGPHAAFADEALNLFAELGGNAWTREALLRVLATSPLLSLQLLLVAPAALNDSPQSQSAKSLEAALHDAAERVGDDLLCLWLHICASRADGRRRAYASLGLHARRTAALAFRLAFESGICEPTHARIAGLWHNLGQIALCWRPGYPGPVSDAREAQLAAGESRQYGSDHGSLLAPYLDTALDTTLDVAWITEAVELHHAPVEFALGMPGLVRVLRAAVALACDEADAVGAAARLVGLPAMRVSHLLGEIMAAVPVSADAPLPGLHAPMFASLLHASFQDLPLDKRSARLHAACALLGQRQLLLCLAGSGADLALDASIAQAPDIEMPLFDTDSICVSLDSSGEHLHSAADWLLARQLGVSRFDCLPWQHQTRRGLCLFAVQQGRASLAQDPVDAKVIELLVSTARAAAAQLDDRQSAVARAVERSVEQERSKAKRIAHEVSNPLTIISNYLAIIENDASLAPPVRDMQRQMRSEIGRIQRLLGKLGQQTPAEPAARHCLPNDVLREVESFFYETLLVRQDIRLGLQLAEGVPQIHVPPDVLKQVLVNLVLNAAEAIGRAGAIDLRSTLDINLDDQAWIELCVEDSGPGLPREGLALTLPKASSKGEQHAGVGLSVTRNLVADMGGRLVCRSRRGAGTSFSILLPIGVESAP